MGFVGTGEAHRVHLGSAHIVMVARLEPDPGVNAPVSVVVDAIDGPAEWIGLGNRAGDGTLGSVEPAGVTCDVGGGMVLPEGE